VAKARIRQGLVDTGWFDDVEVGATDDVDNLVIGMCRFPARLNEDQVARRLARLWEEELRYPFWDAHTTLVWEDQVELEGATRSSAQGHYVTVHIVAQRAAHTPPRVSVIPPQRGGS